ncbi:hypothetical protein YC2023_111378 [Brassica napus]
MAYAKLTHSNHSVTEVKAVTTAIEAPDIRITMIFEHTEKPLFVDVAHYVHMLPKKMEFTLKGVIRNHGNLSFIGILQPPLQVHKIYNSSSNTCKLEGLMLLCGDITAHMEDMRLDSTSRAPLPLISPSDDIDTTGESATGSSQQLHHLRLGSSLQAKSSSIKHPNNDANAGLHIFSELTK